jgi:hypothetical protein
MTLAAEPTRAAEAGASGGPPEPSRRRPAAIAGLVLLVVTPILVGSVAVLGETWLPMSDWAHMTYRTSQVGTRQTPLVGAYSFHGFAHPGPLSFWLSAPLYRLTGSDPRALLWTGAIVNVAAVSGLAAVAWRRGRWPLLLATMLLTALLIHGFGARVVVDIWNPYSPLLPFLLAVFLAWDAALGRRRAIVEAVIPATYAAQAHLAFVPLVVAVVLWAVAWRRWGARVVGEPGEAGEVGEAAASDDAGKEPDDPPARRWRWRWPEAIPRAAGALLAALWVGPLLDLVFDMHNPGRVLKAIGNEQTTVGVVDAPALVGTFVRPEGPWLAGGEPVMRFDIPAANVLAFVAAIALMVACVVVGRRRRLPDVAALATLTIVLLVVSVPGSARLLDPIVDYLTEWLKVVGALVWFTVGWTAWRVAEPRLRAGSRRRLVGAVAAVAVAGSVAWTWGEAADLDVPFNDGADRLNDMRAAMRAGLDPDVQYRVEFAGDWNGYYPGFVYWLQRDGIEVVTADGSGGLKWGHDHRWVEGEPYEQALMVAVHHGGSFSDAYADCVEDPGMETVYEYDPLSPAEREWVKDLTFRRVSDPDSVTAAERRRLHRLYERGAQVAILTGDHLCGVPLAEGKQATG